jgi:methylmalonyl-CoA mutase N-terminal domain/subunit
MEDGAHDYFRQIDQLGGMVAAIEAGFPQREIAESAYRFQQEVERREKIVVGVNDQSDGAVEAVMPTLYIDESAGESQLRKLEQLRASRDAGRVAETLDALRDAARSTHNLMPPILDAVRAYATVGEMCDALRDVWGEYEEVAII